MTSRNLSLLLLWGCRLAIAGLLATMLIGAFTMEQAGMWYLSFSVSAMFVSCCL